MTGTRNRRLRVRRRTPGWQPFRVMLAVLSMWPLIEVTAHSAGAASRVTNDALLDYSTIESGTPSIAKVQLLGVGSPASEFHRTTSREVRGVVGGVELPAPVQNSTVVRSFAWSGRNGVAVGSTIDPDGVVRSALWRTTGHGWTLVVHRFPTVCAHCIEARPEFQFVMWSTELASFVVATSGGALWILTANGLEPLSPKAGPPEQRGPTIGAGRTDQCEVNEVVESQTAIWALGSCSPEFREYRLQTVNRFSFRDRKVVGINAFSTRRLAAFGIAIVGSEVIIFEIESP
jgi:hypothetical protein